MTKGGGNPSPFCDGILTNCNHIEYNYDRKNEKLHHKLCCEGLLLNIDKEQCLSDVKKRQKEEEDYDDWERKEGSLCKVQEEYRVYLADKENQKMHKR